MYVYSKIKCFSTLKIVSKMRPRWYELEMELVSAPKLSSIRVTRISPQREEFTI